MKLYFQNSNGKEKLIAEVHSEDEAYQKIKEFCEERDFKIYYVRTWEHNDVKYFDVGSWSELMVLRND